MLRRGFSSLRTRLLISMLFAALIPILVIDVIMYNRYLDIIQNNTRELTKANLSHIETSLDTWTDSYSDVMRQIYEDEDVREMLSAYYSSGYDEKSRIKSDIRQQLKEILITKEYIMSVTIATADGQVFFYDRVTPFSYNPFWLHEYSMSMREIYDAATAGSENAYFSTEYAKTGPNKKYYLFHMAHAMPYKDDSGEKKAAVIVSIDEQLLERICNPSGYKRKDMVTFMVDGRGRVVAYEDPQYLSADVSKSSYVDFVKGAGTLKAEKFYAETEHDDKLGWDIVNVSVANRYDSEISRIQQMVVSLAVGSAILVVIIVLFTTRYLMSHVDAIAAKMQLIEKGDMGARIEKTPRMPTELAAIADNLNDMLDQLEMSMEKEKMLAEREKSAEIAALEARINPHFLYNTLDTINWMAIDKDEIEISNAISALAKILRYGISNSNGIVSVATEMEWLKQYVYLQQTRLKDTFKFEADVEPHVMQYGIHKLLFQPFVENSIIHGFKNKKQVHMLRISIKADDMLRITIEDNGTGMDAERVKAINEGNFQQSGESGEKYHMGMENAIRRIHMYYGDKADVHIESELGEGTAVYIILPKDGEA